MQRNFFFVIVQMEGQLSTNLNQLTLDVVMNLRHWIDI